MRDTGQLVNNDYQEEQRKRYLDSVFTYHPPEDGQPERYLRLRATARVLAETVMEETKTSREQSLALTAIQEAVMWANAAVAIHG